MSTSNATLRKAYEDQIETLSRELEDIERLQGQKLDYGIPYQTALEKALGLFRNPVEAWENGNLVEKHQLFHFLFDGKLVYNKNSGYRTANSCCFSWLFREFASANPHDVEVAGLNPRAGECARWVYKA